MKDIQYYFNLKNKVAIITGGLGLLGKSHAEILAEFGATVVLLDIEEDHGLNFSKEISDNYATDCIYFKCDISDEKQIDGVKKELLKKYGRIDILINNAAINPKVRYEGLKNLSRLEYFSKSQWDLEISVGLTGAMLCSKIFGFEMAKKKEGVILNVASDLGIIAPDQRIYKKGC